MPIKFGPDERIKSPIDTYVVEKVMNQGAFAHAARAKSTARGGINVFLKRYFAPTKSLSWYEGFVRHQKELKRRISENDALRPYCYGFIDFFEGTEGRSKNTFHQVFEFIENGKELTKYIEELEPVGPTANWDQRVRFARVMMMGIAALHSQKIVDTDLKPANLLLIPNLHSPGEYHLKIIDLDWSIFSDQRAPWHGEQGYIGTPMYQSPEHGGTLIPDERSDVFTCALMLGELLCGGHPFAKVASYPDAIKRGSFEPLRISQPVPKVENPAFLETLLNRALNPDPAKRPTAMELRLALLGRGEAGKKESSSSSERIRHEAEEKARRDAEEKARQEAKERARIEGEKVKETGSIQLMFEGHVVLTMNIDTMVGRGLLKQISPDAQFASESQFRIYRSPSREWIVSPVIESQNETIVNGARLSAATPLRTGMRIAIGNSAKGIEKLPLIVRLT